MALLLAGCGGDDSGASQDTAVAEDTAAEQTVDTADSDTTAASDEAATETTVEAADASSEGTRTVLPGTCDLIDDATAATATGGERNEGQPAATDGHLGALRVDERRVDDLLALVPGAECRIRLRQRGPRLRCGADSGGASAGPTRADEKDRDYRLVTFLAYDGQYYVSVILQGPSRNDVPATQAAESLVPSCSPTSRGSAGQQAVAAAANRTGPPIAECARRLGR